MTALKESPPQAETEALIEEARRRQRRRHRLFAGLVPLAFIAAGIGLIAGGGSPAGPASTANGGGSGPYGGIASWHELSMSAGALPAGTSVSDVIRYRGGLVATGASNPPTVLPKRIGCSASACGTVVWVSRNGQRWRPVFASQQGTGGNALVPTHGGLALIDPGIQSLDARVQRVLTAKSIRAYVMHRTPTWVISPPSREEGQMVFSIGEDDVGPPSPSTPNLNSEPEWASPDGVHWSLNFAHTFRWRSAVKVPGGYVGITQVGNRSIVLWSHGGRSWMRAGVSIPAADVAELASGPHGAVLELISSRFPYRPGHDQFWDSRNGRTWARGHVVGAVPEVDDVTGTMPTLISADGGYLAFDRSITGIWWSKTGRVWEHLRASGAPPSRLAPEAVSVDGSSLLVAVRARNLIRTAGRPAPRYEPGPVTFWRVDLSELRGN